MDIVPIGVTEMLILLVLVVSWLVPIAVAVWIVVTLHRLRTGQQTILSKIDALERRLSP